MPKSYKFSKEQIAELEAGKKKNKNKNVDKRLEALLLRSQNVKREVIAMKIGYSVSYISELTSKYQNNGLGAIVDNHYQGNHRNMSIEEEAELLEAFKEAAQRGQIVETSEILKAYEAKLGRTFEKDHGRIYRVLARHKWRKVMPRSKHPKKASDEVIEASKTLTLR
jgi:transposase